MKNECNNTVQSGDCEQIIDTNSYQMPEGTCDLESCLTSTEVAHSDNECKCDQDLQMLENPGGSLSIPGDNEMPQLEGEDKLPCLEVSKSDSESKHSHTITSTNKFEQSDYLGLHVRLVGTNDSTKTENNKLHSCQITFEDRDRKSEFFVNQNSEKELDDKELEFNRESQPER